MNAKHGKRYSPKFEMPKARSFGEEIADDRLLFALLTVLTLLAAFGIFVVVVGNASNVGVARAEETPYAEEAEYVHLDADRLAETVPAETQPIFEEPEARIEDVIVESDLERAEGNGEPGAMETPDEASGRDGYLESLRYNGVETDGVYRYTWYSENVLPGGGLDIPGRHVGDGGAVMDGDGYICVASSDLERGTVVDTPYGAAKVYDSGCASGTLDVYVSW